MKRKEALYAVIGGFVGAVVTMVVCSFSPLGAQSKSDANFGKITCTEIEVVRTDGTLGLLMFVDEHGGSAAVFDKDGKVGAGMVVAEYGGRVNVYNKNAQSIATMGHEEHNGYVAVYGKDGKLRAYMNVDEHGGRVDVLGKK